jgi:hypothetical protein
MMDWLPEERVAAVGPEEVSEGTNGAGMVGVANADGLLHAVGQVPGVRRSSGRVP